MNRVRALPPPSKVAPASEVERLGSEQLAAVQSMLTHVPIYMLKAEGWPMARDASSWRAQAIRFRGDAAEQLAPSMRQKIDVDQLHRRVLRAVSETSDGLMPLQLLATCQVTLDELLSERAGLRASSVGSAAAVPSHQTQSDA